MHKAQDGMMDESPTAILETPRLLLRQLTLNDQDSLYTLYQDPEVRRYFPEGILSYEQTGKELSWIIDVYYRQYGFGLWATIEKETGAFIGRCGLLPWTIEGQAEVEVAYMLARDRWGQGMATEAARAILEYGFVRLPVRRLICLIDRENQASIRVATKIGMTYQREVEDEYGWASLYATSRPR
jgi:[ribosomal protein S5]-alanine N-acetyltransferase